MRTPISEIRTQQYVAQLGRKSADILRPFRKDEAITALILVIVVLAATWLRFFKLGDWSFWIDEVFTVSDSVYEFKKLSLWDIVHARPLNFLITGWVFSYLPVSEWSARIIPCLAGAITVPLVYYLFYDVLGKSSALLSASFLGLSTWHIYWSQNARGYSLLVLFSLISMCLFYKGVEKDNRFLLFGSVVSTALAYLAHPVALFIVAAYGVYLAVIGLARLEKPFGYVLKQLCLFFVPLLLAMAFVLPGFLRHVRENLTMQQSANPFYVLASISYYIQPAFIVLALCGSVFLIVQRSPLGLFFACLIVIPLTGLFFLSAIMGTSALYVVHTLPVYYMAAAVALGQMIKTLDGRAKGYGIAVVLALFSVQSGMVFEYFTHQHGDRSRWKEASNYVASANTNGYAIVSTSAPVVEYYLNPRWVDLKRPEKIMWLAESNAQEMENMRSETWLLLTNEAIDWGPAGERFKRWLGRQCQMSNLFDAWTSAKNRSVLVYRCLS